jgi:uncharacterized protein (DUF488 family)
VVTAATAVQMQEGLRILTIGHSNHPMEHFLKLLRRHSIQVIADIRSRPYSAYASQFDYRHLMKALRAEGIQYIYLGAELGGRPRGEAYYDADGRVFYGKRAESSEFQEGLARLERGLGQYRVAMLCAEENPAGCHRRLLVGRVLAERGIAVEHIRGDGLLQAEDELSAADGNSNQLGLFDEIEAPVWKSIPSVSLKRRQSDSSAF